MIQFIYIQGELHQTNSSLQQSGKALMTKGEQLVHYRKTQENIHAAIDTLSMALPGMCVQYHL